MKLSIPLLLFFCIFCADTLFAQHNDEGGILYQQAPEWPDMYWIDAQGVKSPPHKLAMYKGKWLYIYFFQAWCPGCHSHGFPTLQRITRNFKDEKRFAAVAIQTVFEGFTSNTKNKVREIQQKYNLSIAMGHDAGTSKHKGSLLMRSYRSQGTPWAILVNPKGQVVFNGFHADAEKISTFIRRHLQISK